MKRLRYALCLSFFCILAFVGAAQAQSSYIYTANGVNSGIAIKVPVLVATTGAITLSGNQTIDGVAVNDHRTDSSGRNPDRVLVKNQSDQTTNGIYNVVNSGAWTRAADFKGVGNVTQGTIIAVYGGSVNGGTLWQVTTADPIHIDGSSPSSIAFAVTPISTLSPVAPDSSGALQTKINGFVSLGSTQNTTIGVPTIPIAAGTYSFLSGITSRPWIKVLSSGSSKFDFSGASSSVTGFRVYNQDSPTADFTNRNSANRGPFLGSVDGSLLLWGPGSGTSSIAVDLGNSSLNTDVSVREASMQNFHIMNWGVGLFLRNIDNYVTNFSHFLIEHDNICFKTGSGLNNNSGERLSFEDGLCAGAAEGYEVNTDAFDTTFHNVSFDFLTGPALLLNSGNGYGKVEFDNIHFEAINKPIIQSNYSSWAFNGDNQMTTIKNSKWVTSVNSPNVDAPNAYAFTGVQNLDVDGWFVGGYGGTSNAASLSSMFMVAPSVNVDRFTGVHFNGWKQLIAQQTLRETDPFFSAGTPATALTADTAATAWTVPNGGCNNMTVSTDNTKSWQTASFTGSISSGILIVSAVSAGSVFPGMVITGSGVSTPTIITGFISGTPNGAGSYFINNTSESVSSESMTGLTQSLKFTSSNSSNFCVVQGDRFKVQSGDRLLSDVAFYGGTSTGTNTVAFQYLFTNSNAGLPSVYSGVAFGDSMATIYGQSSDPAYTGTRAWWAKPNNLLEARVPPGYDAAQLVITVSNQANGDSAWIGFAGTNNLGSK